jgi:hypothetical protein
MLNTTTTRREIALCLYRINLHGTGCKVEDGRLDEALVSISEHIGFASGTDKDHLVGLKEDIAKLKKAS